MTAPARSQTSSLVTNPWPVNRRPQERLRAIVGRYGNRMPSPPLPWTASVTKPPAGLRCQHPALGKGRLRQASTARLSQAPRSRAHRAAQQGWRSGLSRHLRPRACATPAGACAQDRVLRHDPERQVEPDQSQRLLKLAREGRGGEILNDLVMLSPVDLATPPSLAFWAHPHGKVGLGPQESPGDFLSSNRHWSPAPTTITEQLKLGGGYDHNYVLYGKTSVRHQAVCVVEPTTG